MKGTAVVTLAAAVVFVRVAAWILALSPEARYAALSNSERQRMVDEVVQRLEAQGLYPKITGFEFTGTGLEILFENKTDPQALAIVREVIEYLPLEVHENVRCEIIDRSVVNR